MNFLLSILTSLPILWGLRKALKESKPNLALISLGLLVWFVIAPIYTALPLAGIGNWSPAITKTQILALAWSTLIILVASWYSTRQERAHQNDRYAVASREASVAHPKAMLVTAIILTLLAYASSIIFALVGGGRAWLRVEANQFAGMGVLGLFSSNILLFPIMLWYFFLTGYRVPLPLQVVGAAQLLFVAYSFLYSGVTGGPLALLLPFGILWCMRGNRISTLRFVIMCAAGYGGVWLLRFMRLLGQLTSGGQVQVDVSSAMELFETSTLRPGNSFGEFFWFAKVVEHVDGGGQMIHGKSYLLTLLQFVPAYFWPGKVEYLSDTRVDAFVRDVVLKGLYGGLIPVGTYGEAYLAFGFPALVIVAVLLGWLTGFIDSRFRSSLWGIPGPLMCALFCPVIISTCRASSQYVFTSIAPIFMFAVLSRFLRPIGRGADHDFPVDLNVEHSMA
jgi:hypothetical protein